MRMYNIWYKNPEPTQKHTDSCTKSEKRGKKRAKKELTKGKVSDRIRYTNERAER